MRIDLDAALLDLEKLIDRIAELIEWEKLSRQQRRPRDPPGFQFADHFNEDLESLFASGWQLHAEIGEALARDDLRASPEQLRRWQRRLHRLEQCANHLAMTARIIRR